MAGVSRGSDHREGWRGPGVKGPRELGAGLETSEFHFNKDSLAAVCEIDGRGQGRELETQQDFCHSP